MEQLMQVLATKDSTVEYQSLTYTDGIYLQNITGEQLQLVIDYLYHVDTPSTKPNLTIPTDSFIK